MSHNIYSVVMSWTNTADTMFALDVRQIKQVLTLWSSESEAYINSTGINVKGVDISQDGWRLQLLLMGVT